ncbi:hypothetical protein LEP1GSC151_0154, partial [Leptospira interrogans serovar Grippotyphosa str. LT2186]
MERGNANGTRRFVAAVLDINVLNKRAKTQSKNNTLTEYSGFI